jgi:hypothetical protein
MIAARAKEVKEHTTAQAEHDAGSRAKGIAPTQLLFKSKLDFDYEPDDSDFYDSDTEDTNFNDEDDSDAYTTNSSSSGSGISSSARRFNSRRSSSSSRSVSNSKNDYFSGYDDSDIGDVVVDKKFMVSKQKSGRVVVRLC